MNYKEAKEIFESSRSVDATNFKDAIRRKKIAEEMGLGLEELRSYCRGYCEDHQGEEVKGLVEALNMLKKGEHLPKCPDQNLTYDVCSCTRDIPEEALKKYEETLNGTI